MTETTPQSQDEVIALLSSPETFGAARIERVETHASIVFLVGDKAYKLKKALRYSYLDYSTPALRRAACAAEFAINWRFAPNIYLGVQAVARSTSGVLSLNGEGQPVDWVVVMRRFDQAAQFDRMAENHALPIELMRDLADGIAKAHDGAEVRPQFGGLGGLRKAIDITIENLRLAVGYGLARDDVEAWTDQALRSLDALAPLLEKRRLAGQVRACHGDLHLQNICLFDGRPTLFDAIEFDPAISSTDTLYDLAFLLMDLHHRGLDTHGCLVFNRYLDRRDEIDGLPALPLFMSVRAAIRAQVSAAAAQHRHDTGDTGALVDRARGYLALALGLLAPLAPRLVTIGGFSGTGKSTLAYSLAPALTEAPGARVLRTDVIRKRAAGVDPETPLPPESYTQASHEEVYRLTLAEARTCLKAGRAVVVDAVFAKEAERSAFRSLAAEVGASFRGIWLEAPIEILERRVLDRKHDASDARIDVLRKQMNYGGRPCDWAQLDASGPIAAIAVAALNVVRDPNAT
jgi:aminoglycoside phosphotransferase family enzyme/predicted kinase